MATRECKILYINTAFAACLSTLLYWFPSQLLDHRCDATMATGGLVVGQHVSSLYTFQLIVDVTLGIEVPRTLDIPPRVWPLMCSTYSTVSLVIRGQDGRFLRRKAEVEFAFLHTLSMWWFQLRLLVIVTPKYLIISRYELLPTFKRYVLYSA